MSLYYENHYSGGNPEMAYKVVNSNLRDCDFFLKTIIEYINKKKYRVSWESVEPPDGYEIKIDLENFMQEVIFSATFLYNQNKKNFIRKFNPKKNRIFLESKPEGDLYLEDKKQKIPYTIIKAEGDWIELLPHDDDTEEEFRSSLCNFLEKKEKWVYQDESCKDGLEILNRRENENLLCLDSKPSSKTLYNKGNSYVWRKQKSAVNDLKSFRRKYFSPLIELCQSRYFASWSSFYKENLGENDWRLLTNTSLPGTAEQKEFVKISLATKDFSFLWGPPGSGKTTAICELIYQAAKKGLRILLCASTHVAVDNVLERIGQLEEIIPVRIGEEGNISEEAKQYQLQETVKTSKNRLIRNLIDKTRNSQKMLLQTLQSENGNATIERLILDCANLVCGTTIGILRHPDIYQSTTSSRPFDLMILDEASKTPFLEFLVPALHAKKWIIVGDPRQLSPYVDQELIGKILEIMAISNEKKNRSEHYFTDMQNQQVWLDVFKAHYGNFVAGHREFSNILVISDDLKLIELYRQQASALNIPYVELSPSTQPLEVLKARIILSRSQYIEQHVDIIPFSVKIIRGKKYLPAKVSRTIRAWQNRAKNLKDRIATRHEISQSWAEEVTWRMIRLFELRREYNPKEKENYEKQFQMLLPGIKEQKERIEEKLNWVNRLFFPSVLETLQEGLGESESKRNQREQRGYSKNALIHGLPENILQDRLTKLSYQHRMHPDISAFPREHFYNNEALSDIPDLRERRDINCNLYPHRSYWIHVQGKENFNRRDNPQEILEIQARLEKLFTWFNSSPPKQDGRSWEIGILTFYKAQERGIREKLRQITDTSHGRINFTKRFRHMDIKIKLCTVDRFQGQEADIVFLSLVRTKSIGFLNSPNRLNVALTRARNQLVIFGNLLFFQKQNRSNVLKKLAEYHNQKGRSSIVIRGENYENPIAKKNSNFLL